MFVIYTGVTHMETAGRNLVFPLSLSALLFETGSLIEPEAPILAKLAGQRAARASCGLRDAQGTARVSHVCFGDLN